MCLPARGAASDRTASAATNRTKGAVVDLAPLVRRLGGRDLLERAAQVHGRGAGALGRGPGHRAVERPVELERGRAVAVPLERPAVPRRAAVAGQPRHLMRAQVEHDDPGRARSSSRRATGASACDVAAERAEVARPARRPTAASRPARRASPPRAPPRTAGCRRPRCPRPRARGRNARRCRRTAPGRRRRGAGVRRRRRANRLQAEPRHEHGVAGKAERRGEHVVGQSHPRARRTARAAGARRRRRRPAPLTVASIERSSTAAVPSSSGCASGAGGWTHSRP